MLPKDHTQPSCCKTYGYILSGLGVLHLRAFVLRAEGRYEEALIAYRRLIELNPNITDAYSQVALCHMLLGQTEPAVPLLREAIRRDPRDPLIWIRYNLIGQALLRLQAPQDAVVWLLRALDDNPMREERSSLWTRMMLTSALGYLGRTSEGRRQLAQVMTMEPFLTVRLFISRSPPVEPLLTQQRYIAEGLRLAGLRDHVGEDAPGPEVSDGVLRNVPPEVTPRTVPGAVTINTPTLLRTIETEQPVLIDLSPTGATLPGAVILHRRNFQGGSLEDEVQQRVHRKMLALTSGDMARPVVVIGWNAESVTAHNLVVRLVTLGHTDVRWYRDGKEIWEVRGLPEVEGRTQDF